MSDDPFRHHPALRGLITPPEQSRFWRFTLDAALAMLAAAGTTTDHFLTEDEREAERARFMQGHTGDLWVFGYGSLMWDPGFVFAEVRRAHAPGVTRTFCFVEDGGGRGRPEAPGVMAALDRGDGCDGLVFRITAAQVETETYHLWARERLGPAYLPAFVTAETEVGPVEALTFLADHAAPMIHPELTWADQVRYCATGEGVLGTSLQYVETLAAQFAQMGIDDPQVSRLLAEARAYRAASAP